MLETDAYGNLRIIAPGIPPKEVARVLGRLALGRLTDYDTAELDQAGLLLLGWNGTPSSRESAALTAAVVYEQGHIERAVSAV